jgi:ATP-dependent RNA helicase DDX35
VRLGEEVGYTIRFEDQTNPGMTMIKFLTDGVLIREMMEDPLLTKYSVIMVDEAHERSISTDMLLGLLKKIQRRRPDLRLIISSATIEARSMSTFFNIRSFPYLVRISFVLSSLPSVAFMYSTLGSTK